MHGKSKTGKGLATRVGMSYMNMRGIIQQSFFTMLGVITHR
jgi:hypothetical protein